MPRDESRRNERKPPAAGISTPKPAGVAHAGGRPPGAKTITRRVPGDLPGGTSRQTPLKAPVPSPTRQGLPTRDRRDVGADLAKSVQQVKDEPKIQDNPAFQKLSRTLQKRVEAGESLSSVVAEAGAEERGKPVGAQPSGAAKAIPGQERAAKLEEQKASIEQGLVPGVSAEGEPGTGKAVFRMERNITDFREMENAPAGLFQTPQGTLEKLPDGRLKVKDLSAEAKVIIEKVKMDEIRSFGNFPGMDDPNAPPPPVEVGTPWFNPFTGIWGNGGLKPELDALEPEVE